MVSRQEVVQKVSAYVQRAFNGSDEAAYKRCFDAADTDADARISTGELEGILSRAGVGFALTRWPIAKAIIETLDIDGDWFVEWSEFLKVFHGG